MSKYNKIIEAILEQNVLITKESVFKILCGLTPLEITAWAPDPASLIKSNFKNKVNFSKLEKLNNGDIIITLNLQEQILILRFEQSPIILSSDLYISKNGINNINCNSLLNALAVSNKRHYDSGFEAGKDSGLEEGKEYMINQDDE